MKIMKKIIVLTLALVICATNEMFADNDKSISLNELPAVSREFIATHFPNEKVAIAKIDRDLGEKTYEVIFAGSAKIEFLGKGDWREVDCQFTRVPDAVVPEQIKKYIEGLYADAYVVKIERDRRGYEVRLNTRLELEFDNRFNIVDIDD